MLLVPIATAIFAMFWIYCLMHWMAEGELSGPTGLVAIVASILMVGVGVSAKSEIITYGVMLLFLVAPFTVPMYDRIAGQASDRELDLQKFERAHAAFAKNPDNVGSRFDIAKLLAKLGLYGHAIAIAKGAESLLTDDQGVHQRGTKLMFSRELSDMRYWETQAKPEDYRSVHCPKCKVSNPPGTIACLKCQAPFLLDIVREGTTKAHIGSKVVLAWLGFAALLAGGAAVGSTVSGWMVIFPIATLVIAIGGFLSWMLKDRIKFA